MINGNPRVHFFLQMLLAAVLVVGPLYVSSATAIELTATPSVTRPEDIRLARVLNFSTDVPTRTSFRVHGPGEAWIVESDVLRTEHSVPVMGLTFAKDYTLDQLTLTDTAGNAIAWEEPLSFTTVGVPPNFPTINIKTSQPDRMEPGYTLFPAGGGNTLAVDAHGTPRWRYIGAGPDIHQAANGLLLARVNGTIREFDFLGNMTRAWRATGTPPSEPVDIAVPVEAANFHHDVALIESSGNILTLSQSRHTVDNFPIIDGTDPNPPTATVEIVSDPILEIATDGTIVNSWDLVDILDRRRGGYGLFDSPTVQDPGVADWSHSNAVLHDPRDDSIIVSVRNQDAVIKFDRNTGDLKWILGPHQGWGPEFEPYLLEPVGDDFEWPYHTHAPMLLPNGNLMVHDNGNFRARPFDPPLAGEESYTRAVEYTIDEDTMEVTQVWEYGKDAEEVIYSAILGDADWLSETDNVLITFGSPSFIDHERPEPIPGRIVEVDRNGEVVFDLELTARDGMSRTLLYRSERVPSLYGPEYTVTMLPVQLPDGDFNANGQVEQGDLDLVLLHWGQDGSVPPDGWESDPPSGLIDQAELDLVLLNWGETSTIMTAQVPEPSAWLIGLIAAGAVGLLRRRRIVR